MKTGLLNARTKTLENLSLEEIRFWDVTQLTEVRNTSPFFSRHFASAVSQAGVDVRVCVIYERDQIRALFPYQFSDLRSRLLCVAEPIGAGMSDYFGVIAPSDFFMRDEELLKLSNLNYVGFSHFSETQLPIGLSASDPRIGLRVVFDADSAPYLANLKIIQKKYINDAARLERKLSEDVGTLRFEYMQHENVDGLLDLLIKEKRDQYTRTSVADALKEDWKRRLLHELVHTQQPNFRGVLSVLHAGNEPVALHFGISSNATLHYWFPVYRTQYHRYAPGRLLLLKLIKANQEGNFTELDMGEGESDEKRKLANFEHQYFRGAWHNRSVPALIHRSFQSLAWRLNI